MPLYPAPSVAAARRIAMPTLLAWCSEHAYLLVLAKSVLGLVLKIQFWLLIKLSEQSNLRASDCSALEYPLGIARI